MSIRLREVAVDDPRAVAMRELLAEDLHARYASINGELTLLRARLGRTARSRSRG